MKYEVSAGGIVYKKESDTLLFLITQHSKNKHWGFPKGHIGDTIEGETMEAAALREVEEEGGVQAKIIEKVPDKIEYFYKLNGELVKKNLYYYLMEYVSGDPQNHDFEVSEAKFVMEEEARKTLTFKSDRDAFEKALQLMK